MTAKCEGQQNDEVEQGRASIMRIVSELGNVDKCLQYLITRSDKNDLFVAYSRSGDMTEFLGRNSTKGESKNDYLSPDTPIKKISVIADQLEEVSKKSSVNSFVTEEEFKTPIPRLLSSDLHIIQETYDDNNS